MREERFLTVAEVAARLKVPPATVGRWIPGAKLRATMVRGTETGYRVPGSEAERLVAAGFARQERKAS